jgi:magnesium transporter
MCGLYKLSYKYKNKDHELRYLRIAYVDIGHLIELLLSYGDAVNSTMDLYIANGSLRLNDTMRILIILVY